MKLSTMALGAAAVLLLSGSAYAQNTPGNSMKPCSQQAARGNASGAPPDSQQASAQQAARGNDSGAPPNSQPNGAAQQAARSNPTGAPPNSQLAANGSTNCQ